MTETQEVHDETMTATNKYGEIVGFHGPVCATCHQRIAQPVINPTPLENICKHCADCA